MTTAGDQMSSLIGLYLFGSAARGDSDHSSDIDILALYDQQPEDALRKSVVNSVCNQFGRRATLAEYSIERLQAMFNEGHLFAWHLYQEACPLKCPGLILQQSISFATPAPYKSGVDDANRFIRLLSSVSEELQHESCSLVHEAGLVYLSLRNIAMSLSINLQHKADFSRKSPLNVSSTLKINPPCAVCDYNVLVACRHASQRGLSPPVIDGIKARDLTRSSLEWAYTVLEMANE